MVDREREARKKWNDDTALPWSTFAVRADDSVDDRISDPVLDLDLVNDRPACTSASNILGVMKSDSRGNEELVLDIDEVLRHLDRYMP